MKIEMKFYTRFDGRGCVGTVCLLSLMGNMSNTATSFGTARQNPKDKNNPFTGRKLALERAINGIVVPKGYEIKKEQRKEIWEHFFMQHEVIQQPLDKQFGIIDDNAVTADEYNELKEENRKLADLLASYDVELMKSGNKYLRKNIELSEENSNLKKTIAKIDKLLGGTGA